MLAWLVVCLQPQNVTRRCTGSSVCHQCRRKDVNHVPGTFIFINFLLTPLLVLLCSGRAHLSSTVRSRAKSINDTRHRHILHTVAATAAHRRWIINNYVYETFGCFSPCFPIPSPSPSGASATAASKVDAFFELCSLLLCPSGRCPRGVSFCFVVAK